MSNIHLTICTIIYLKNEKSSNIDLDNTILYQTNRNPFNWSDLSGDVIIPEMEQMINFSNPSRRAQN
jgi:hypothetical protein